MHVNVARPQNVSPTTVIYGNAIAASKYGNTYQTIGPAIGAESHYRNDSKENMHANNTRGNRWAGLNNTHPHRHSSNNAIATCRKQQHPKKSGPATYADKYGNQQTTQAGNKSADSSNGDIKNTTRAAVQSANQNAIIVGGTNDYPQHRK